MDKPGVDPLFKTNWRPPTLMNCDYKIYAKSVANRLSMVLSKLIHPDQTGFMKTRFLGENIQDMLAVIQIAKDRRIPTYVMSVDFKKALDSVEWDAMFAVLKAYNFGPEFLDMIGTYYHNT